MMAKFRLVATLSSGLIIAGVLLAFGTVDSKRSVETSDYAGQQSCIEAGCHADNEGAKYQGAEEFRKTMHTNIHNRPTPENVIIDDWFANDTTLKYRETRINTPPRDTLFIDLSKQGTEDEYYIRLRTIGQGADSTPFYRVAYNYGGNGWLQRFLLDVDGSYYPAPFQYVLPSYKTTDVDTGTVYFLDVRRWYSVNTVDAQIEFFDRTKDEFLSQSWDKRCAACHVNGFSVDSVIVNDDQTQWHAKWVGVDKNDSALTDANIQVGCESCHGPAADHVADAQANPDVEDQDPDILERISPGRWDPLNESRYWTDRKLDVCNQCHNRHSSTTGLHTYAYDDDNDQPYTPREELNNYVRDSTADARYWGDGVTSSAHHQSGQDYWRSSHYSGHVFKNGCFDCHKPHQETDYPYQLDRNWYSMERGDGCLAFGCHLGFEQDSMATNGKVYNKHSEHLQEHSQCVNCHYTKTATITFTGHNEFSDHSDQVIRPTATLQYTGHIAGMPNTCAASCHRNGYGSRNRPDAYDRNMSVRMDPTTEVTEPMRAPDYGISDVNFDIWKDPTDLWLADSLWRDYTVMYAEYVSGVREGRSTGSVSGIRAVRPNPTHSPVSVEFSVTKAQNIRMDVYTVNGELVRRVLDARHEEGDYTSEWDLVDELNNPVPGGVYFIRMTGDEFTSTRSVVVSR